MGSPFRRQSLTSLFVRAATFTFTLTFSGIIVAEPKDAKEAKTFENVRALLKAHCHSCHGAEKQEAGLRLDRRDRAFEGSDHGKVIVAKKSNESSLVHRITSDNPDERMPPEGKPLSKTEIATLTKWIDNGAFWPEEDETVDPQVANHWAYQPIVLHRLPVVEDRAWSVNGIDYFVLSKLENENVRPSPVAKRSTLIRRLYLDLIGLPPSPNEWARWINESAADWYDQLVDHLLASPHYGERWARYWLDQARYADTDGYEKDSPRPHAYNWRDWVIDAFNRDLPFDQFSVQQIAGDLLPGATAEVRLATGFHRNTLTNREGGIDKEEDRVKQVVDRINTVSSVWLGLTVKCAQCHTHKYDPITQREYFQLYAFFNNADETDFKLNATRQQKRKLEKELREHTTQLETAKSQFASLRQKTASKLAEIESSFLKKHPNGIPSAPTKSLVSALNFDQPDKITFDHVQQKQVRFNGDDPAVASNRRRGSALKFNGKNQQLELGQLFDADSESSFTLSAWVNSESGIGGIITKMNEEADFRGIDFTNNQGMLEVHLVHKWPSDSIKVTSKGRLKKNQWHHVLATYDGSKKASGVAIYIDGNKQKLDVHFDQLKNSLAIDEPFRVGSRRRGTFFKGLIDDVHIYNRVLSKNEIELLAGDPALEEFLKTARIPATQRTPEQQAAQMDFAVRLDPDSATVLQRLQELEKKRPSIRVNTGMGLVQRQTARRTFVHVRGDFLQKADEVTAATPKFLPPLEPRAAIPDRLDLARWIFDDRNTLTARVIVNRFWQEFFGQGLVDSDQDFGSQGSPPTHPELLDWLASTWKQQGWSIKQLHRLIVTSATYRQSSNHRQDLAEKDPYNHLLAKQRRQRVSAETVRDLALSASGLLDRKVRGPSVFPPVPAGTIELAFVDVINRGPWKVSPGGDRFRRGLYTFFQRTAPYPMLSLFDAPDSNVTCTRREKSNTPLQALTLWNDPVFMECARAMAIRTLTHPDSNQHTAQHTNQSETARIRFAFLLTVGYEPNEQEVAVVQTLLEKNRKLYSKSPQQADQLLGKTTPRSIAKVELAAWTAVCRALLNLDGFITRE